MRGSLGRAQAGRAGPERRGEGQRKLCWPALPQPPGSQTQAATCPLGAGSEVQLI